MCPSLKKVIPIIFGPLRYFEKEEGGGGAPEGTAEAGEGEGDEEPEGDEPEEREERHRVGRRLAGRWGRVGERRQRGVLQVPAIYMLNDPGEGRRGGGRAGLLA